MDFHCKLPKPSSGYSINSRSNSSISSCSAGFRLIICWSIWRCVGTVRKKSAMSRPWLRCSSVARRSSISDTTTRLQMSASRADFSRHLSVAPRSGMRVTSLSRRAAILPARCQPDVIRHEVAHDDGSLLALDQHHRRRGSSAVQQVFAERALPEMEVRQMRLRMNPTDIRPWLLYPMPGSGIVQHDFPGPHLSLSVRLPEDGSAAPFG